MTKARTTLHAMFGSMGTVLLIWDRPDLPLYAGPFVYFLLTLIFFGLGK